MHTQLDFKFPAEGLALAHALRALGMQPKGYELASPYDCARHRIRPLAPRSPHHPLEVR